jgi:hypothetical protein
VPGYDQPVPPGQNNEAPYNYLSAYAGNPWAEWHEVKACLGCFIALAGHRILSGFRMR